MATNKAVKEALLDDVRLFGQTRLNVDEIVTVLIDAGLIEADVLTKPEQLAERAYKWLGTYSTQNPKDAFGKASGWSTESWTIVANDNLYDDLEFKFNMPDQIKHIFAALVIMAKKAGIEL